jgi:5,10-methylene-tetrahydrofolate dehydrogenase/methenyl tetrahydrofolate cyclohydrolase
MDIGYTDGQERRYRHRVRSVTRAPATCPMTIAMLMRNTLRTAKLAHGLADWLPAAQTKKLSCKL